MVELTEGQKDVLTEVVNLGMGRAASSLSRLTGERVLLEVPRIAILTLDRLDEELAPVLRQEVCSVLQGFHGDITGDAILFLPVDSAANLVGLLVGRSLPLERITELEQAALMEVGNIVINACLGSLSNLLETRFSFLVPQVAVRNFRAILRSGALGEGEAARVCLLIESRFRVKEREVDGYLAVVVGVESARALAAAADRLARKAGVEAGA
ncbi:MAG: chemotaxis protein CheC [Deferrisomatales bacterium]